MRTTFTRPSASSRTPAAFNEVAGYDHLGATPEIATLEAALTRAPEALATILEAYIKDRRPIPPPSGRRTKYGVTVPALVEAKIRPYEAMRAAKVGKAELDTSRSANPFDGLYLIWYSEEWDGLSKHSTKP